MHKNLSKISLWVEFNPKASRVSIQAAQEVLKFILTYFQCAIHSSYSQISPHPCKSYFLLSKTRLLRYIWKMDTLSCNKSLLTCLLQQHYDFYIDSSHTQAHSAAPQLDRKQWNSTVARRILFSFLSHKNPSALGKQILIHTYKKNPFSFESTLS